jgi:hypothetical protein
MESKMGADLSDVKIHTGSKAHEMSEGINAKAFTYGQDIYFKDGNYDPGSKEGKELLAHELAHTVQQGGDGIGRMIQRWPDGIDPNKILTSPNAGDRPMQAGSWSNEIYYTIDGDGDQVSKELVLIFKGKQAGPDCEIELKVYHQLSEEVNGPYKFIVKNRKLQNILVYQYSFTDGFKPGYIYFEDQEKIPAVTDPNNEDQLEARDQHLEEHSLLVYPPTSPGLTGDYRFALGDQSYTTSFTGSKMSVVETVVTSQWEANELGLPSIDVTLGYYQDKFRFVLRQEAGTEAENGKYKTIITTIGLSPNGSAVKGTEYILDLGKPIQELGFSILSRNSTSVVFDLDGDGSADLTVRTEMYQRDSERSAEVARSVEVHLYVPGYSEPAIHVFTLTNGQFNFTKARTVEAFRSLVAGMAQDKLTNIYVPDTIEKEIGKLSGEINALIYNITGEQVGNADTYEAWKSLSEAMIFLFEVVAKGPMENTLSEKAFLESAEERAKTFYELFKAETIDAFVTTSSGTQSSSTITETNPYTGERTTTTAAAFIDPLVSHSEHNLAGEIHDRQWDSAKLTFLSLGYGYAKWIADQLKSKYPEKAGIADQLTLRGSTFKKLEQLRRNPDIINLRRVRAVFYGWESFHAEGGNLETAEVELPLYQYYNKEDSSWYLIDFLHSGFRENPDSPFEVSMSASMPGSLDAPPPELFQDLNNSLHLPEGSLFYEAVDGTGGEVKMTEPWSTSTWLSVIGLGIAAIGITVATAGAGSEVIGIYASYIFALSSGVFIASAVADMIEHNAHGQLTDKVILLDTLEVFTSLCQLKLAFVGRISASATGFLGFARGFYVPLKVGSIIGEGSQILILTYDTAMQIRAVLNGPGNDEDKQRAVMILVSQLTITGGLTMLDLHGEASDIKKFQAGGRDISIDETTVGGTPQPYLHFTGQGDMVVQQTAGEVGRMGTLDLPYIDNDVREELSYMLGMQQVKNVDLTIKSDPTRSEQLVNAYGTRDVYNTLYLSGNNFDEAERLLKNDNWNKWIRDLEDPSQINDLFRRKPDLRNIYENMDPRVRKICTSCTSPCSIIESITDALAERLKGVFNKIPGFNELHAEWKRLKEYLLTSTGSHRNKDIERDKLDAAIKKLEDGNITNDQQLTQFLDNDIIQYGMSKRSHIVLDVYKEGGLWKVRTPNGVVGEYDMGTYRALGKKGTDSFFQAHHGIQDLWGENRFNQWIDDLGLTAKYNTQECPAINLRDSRKGSPHQIITNYQRSLDTQNLKYDQMVDELRNGMGMAGVPTDYIEELVTESNRYFGDLYTSLKNDLVDNLNYTDADAIVKLREIFGSFVP